MISAKSYNPLIWVYNFGSWLNIFPYYWNKNEGCLVLTETRPEMREKYKFWKRFAIFNISLRIGVLILVVLLLNYAPNVVGDEIILLIFMGSVFLMSTTMHMVNFWLGSELVIHMNTLLQVNRNSGNQAAYIFSAHGRHRSLRLLIILFLCLIYSQLL